MKLEDVILSVRILGTYHLIYDLDKVQIKTYKTAIEALKKQIPKKPTDKKDLYDGTYGKCPGCNSAVDEYHDSKYCASCGQALDWSIEPIYTVDTESSIYKITKRF